MKETFNKCSTQPSFSKAQPIVGRAATTHMAAAAVDAADARVARLLLTRGVGIRSQAPANIQGRRGEQSDRREVRGSPEEVIKLLGALSMARQSPDGREPLFAASVASRNLSAISRAMSNDHRAVARSFPSARALAFRSCRSDQNNMAQEEQDGKQALTCAILFT